MTKLKNRKFNWLKDFFFKAYKISSVNQSSLEEKTISSFNGYQVLVYFLYLFLLLLLFVFLLIGYTPLNRLLPSNSLSKKKEIIDLIIKVDSLEKDLLLKNQYVNIITRIIDGEVVDSFLPISTDTSLFFDNLDLSPSKADSILRESVTQEDLYNVFTTVGTGGSSLEDFVFFKPVEGVVTDPFNVSKKHYGVDVAAHEGASVKSCLDGVVIFADWSISSGNMILIQHIDNIISVYMHNSSLTKKSNDLVKAGEVIGIVGNSGELSSGPHLHFELWQNGNAINPQEYIDF